MSMRQFTVPLMLHIYNIQHFSLLQFILTLGFNSSSMRGLIFEQYGPKRHSMVSIPLSMFFCHLFMPRAFLCPNHIFWVILKSLFYYY